MKNIDFYYNLGLSSDLETIGLLKKMINTIHITFITMNNHTNACAR